jgi:filamentous hemagglutinin family protein
MTATARPAATSNPAVARPWLILAMICLPVFIGSLDLTIVSAFLPEVILDLGLPLQTTLDDAAWIVTGYLLAYAVSMMFMGRLSDLIGRRKVYVACLIVFMIGSVLVATSHLWPTDFLYSIFRRLGQRPAREEITLLAIILGRVVQALGAGALVPVSLALVSDLFPKNRRAQPLGFIGAVDTLGWVLGHLYGGILVNWFATQSAGFTQLLTSLGLDWPPPNWHTLFWINVPLTLLALVFVLVAMRHVKEERGTGRFDLLGTLLIAAAFIALIVGLGANTELDPTLASFEDASPLPPYAVPVLLLALGCFIAFIVVESRVKDPLIDLRLFRRRNLASGALVNLFIGFCLMIGLVIVPILVNVRETSVIETAPAVTDPAQLPATPLEDDDHTLADAALRVGILLSALTVPMAIAAIPGGWLSDRFGYRAATSIGLGLALVGFVLVYQTWTLELSDTVIALQMVLVGVGIGLTFSPISAAVINTAPEDQHGVASALVIILRLIGMTVATSSLTTLALNRINALSISSINVDISAAGGAEAFIAAYAGITVQVLGEVALIGAGLCALGLLPALVGLRRTQQ